MKTVKPIKNAEEIIALKNYYLNEKYNLRNHLLIVMGMNTALRISDLLSLKWKDVYIFENNTIRKHITLIEKKTKKESVIAVNESTQTALYHFFDSLPFITEESYIFFSPKCPKQPLSRFQAHRIIKEAAEFSGIEDTISCHSLRKTFGYQAWKKGISPAVIMNIYNHSSYRITTRYLGIEQDDRDAAYLQMNL